MSRLTVREIEAFTQERLDKEVFIALGAKYENKGEASFGHNEPAPFKMWEIRNEEGNVVRVPYAEPRGRIFPPFSTDPTAVDFMLKEAEAREWEITTGSFLSDNGRRWECEICTSDYPEATGSFSIEITSWISPCDAASRAFLCAHYLSMYGALTNLRNRINGSK